VRTFRKLQIASLVGILIVCTARIALTTYMPVGTHPGYLWFRTLWGCFLISLVWLVKGQFVAGVIFGRAKQQWDGILPALETLTFFYALTSISLMTIFSYLPDHPLLNSIHMPAQIIMATIFSTIILTLYIAYIGAMHGTKSSPEATKILYELRLLLEVEEDRFLQFSGRDTNEDVLRLHDALKVLREKISHSLPRCGSVTYSSSYAAISTTLQDLVDAIKAIDPSEASMKASINQITDRALTLSREIGVLSKNRRPS
jgi:magnesium-transporting ATPase (P-type)